MFARLFQRKDVPLTMPKTKAELEAELVALKAQIATDEAEAAALEPDAVPVAEAITAAEALPPSAGWQDVVDKVQTPDTPAGELVYTHRTSRGTLCACDFGASESTGGAGTGGHADGLHPEMQEDGSAGALAAKRAATKQEIAGHIEQLRALEASLGEAGMRDLLRELESAEPTK